MRERIAALAKLPENVFRVRGEFSHVYRDPATGRWVIGLAGNVQVHSSEISVRAENVVVWFDQERAEERRRAAAERPEDEPAAEDVPSIPFEAVEEIYADRDVTVEMGRETIQAERFWVDLRTGRAIILDASVATYDVVRGRVVPLHVRATEIRQLGEGYFTATEASVTNCGFGRPHWHLRASHLTLDNRSPGEALVRADNPSFRVGDLPIFWLPFFQGDLSSGSSYYFRGARVGRSSRLGAFAFTEWGERIRLGSGADRFTWGDWTLSIDPMEKRGVGVGLDVDYAVDRDAARYFGRFRSYYLHDSGDEDKNDQPIEDRDRGRVRLQHRHELPFAVEGTFEISYLSDRNFLSEFFEREAKTGKEQETVAYAKRIFADQAVTALGKWRINDFQTTTEYLPQIGYQAFSKPLLPGSPLGTNLYYSNETQIANVRFRPSEDLPDDEADSRRTTRIDSRHQLNVPLSLGDFHLNPFVEGRYTHYEEPLDPDAQGDIARFAASSGFRLGTQAWRTYDADIRRLRVRGIRHVINPEIRYVNRWAATQSPESLIQFDEVDAVRKLQFLELSMRNRLQTRGGAQVRTFVDWRTANRYFPDAARDNDGDPWGNLENDVRARLSERLLVFWDSEYDWYAHGFAVMNTGLRLVPSEDVRIILAHRFLRDRASIVTAGVEYRLSRKWAVEMLEQVDTKSGRELESRVVLQRHTHDWVFEFTLSADRNEGDTRVSVAVYPRELYQGARQRRRFDREPFLERGPIFGLDRD